MKAFLEGLTTYCCSAYNTQHSTVVFASGKNFFALAMPDQPDQCVTLAYEPAAADPSSPVRRPEFNLVVRTPQNDTDAAAALTDDLVNILRRASNPVPGHPALVRAIQEPGVVGKDSKNRIVIVTRFAVWSITL